jgi:hypothetical protein
MNFVEQNYMKLKEIINFKKDLNSKRTSHRAAMCKMKPSYNMQAYQLMNKAFKIIYELHDYINCNSSMFTDIEVENIYKLYQVTHNVSKTNRESAFKFLEDTVKYRMKNFRY